MSKKKKNHRKPDVSRSTDYYKLKTKAVRDLVEANEENSPEVSEEELAQYRSGANIKVSDWVKLQSAPRKRPLDDVPLQKILYLAHEHPVRLPAAGSGVRTV